MWGACDSGEVPERQRPPRFNEQRLGGTPRPTEPQTRKVQNMRKIKIMLSAWYLVASGQWLVASAVLPMWEGCAPYVGGSGSLRWGFGFPTLGVRVPYVGGGGAPYVGGSGSLRWRGALGDRALPMRTGRGRPPGGP